MAALACCTSNSICKLFWVPFISRVKAGKKIGSLIRTVYHGLSRPAKPAGYIDPRTRGLGGCFSTVTTLIDGQGPRIQRWMQKKKSIFGGSVLPESPDSNEWPPPLIHIHDVVHHVHDGHHDICCKEAQLPQRYSPSTCPSQ